MIQTSSFEEKHDIQLLYLILFIYYTFSLSCVGGGEKTLSTRKEAHQTESQQLEGKEK